VTGKDDGDLKLLIVAVVVLLAACNLETATPLPGSEPQLGGPTPDTRPFVGEVIPSGTGTCVVTAEVGDVPIHASPGDDATVIATFGNGLSAYSDAFNAGWYAIGWFEGMQENNGWVDADLVISEGSCPVEQP
jgi:hypothetical protein